MAAIERYISGIKSNHLYQDGISNPGFGLYLTNERIFGIKDVSLMTHLINPRIFSFRNDCEIIDHLEISTLEHSCHFSIKKDDLEKIELKKPKGGKILKWTIMGDFMGLGSITFYSKSGQKKYSLLLNNEGYSDIKQFLEKYTPQYLRIIE